ncbi:hypothetical protein F0562_033296 [Nyssa sinensis]|uniref:NPH3 domain-containing protein n=1 Tax=Nyssa sinensis TaxID=561372 RepID=A0A5J5AVY2_9ASTE|nr:hypothetical protein F0562_033296 [Nyssa sinensis]
MKELGMGELPTRPYGSKLVIVENLVPEAPVQTLGISRSSRKPLSSSIHSESEQKELLETIIANLPLEKSYDSSTATRFLFGLLRTANILNASEACRAALERKIGSQLEQATLDDLLIPRYSYLNETLYDVVCVERILGYFLDGLEERSATRTEGDDENSSIRLAALMLVGKLIDGYLSEIASDANLKLEKFYELAVALPEHARLVLSHNPLGGSIPKSMGKLSGLQVLKLVNNGLTGRIPVELGNAKELTEILLSRNNLSGSIPEQD